jgi:uncharacterized membrane protein YdbT with pleckstrin-like domain
MAYQPYLTIKELYIKKDKSQIFLMGLSALTPAIGYTFFRIIWDLVKYQRIWLTTGKVFVVAAAVQAAVLLYLGYWILEVWRRENES